MEHAKPPFEQTIVPGHGLGIITFGLAPQEVRAKLGDPEELENFDPEGRSVEGWLYPSLGVSVFFQKCGSSKTGRGEQLEVTLLGTAHSSATLWGKSVIGQAEAEIVSHFLTHGINDLGLAEQELHGAYGLRVLRSEELSLSLDFLDGHLQQVQFSQPSVAPNIEAPL